MATPIDISRNTRLCIQLGWGANHFTTNQKQPNFLQRLFGVMPSPSLGEAPLEQIGELDLDLSCYAFDMEGNLLDTVRPGQGRDINDSGSIYHSGDEESGNAGEYDEELFVELAKLPPSYHTLLFYIRIANTVEVGPENSVKVRVTDSSAGRILLQQRIPFEQTHEKGYLFGRLTRARGAWRYIPLNAYLFRHPDGREAESFSHYLAPLAGG